MRILIGLTYYRPHYSGLTIYTERLARALVELGHDVTVLTSRFDPDLPTLEVQNGVKIHRLPVGMRISKGVIMPGMPLEAWKAIQSADVINLHIPQLDASYIGLLSKLKGKPVVLTYHCDLLLPKGIIHWIANQVSHVANHISALAADCIVTNTRDYAEHSPFLRNYLGKVKIIPPPVVLPSITEEDILAFRQKYQLKPGERIVGMAARLASEKGVEYLIQALPKVIEQYPDTRAFFVGQYENVMGEEAYAARLAPRIAELGSRWSFLGVLPPKELAVFFHECTVTVLPSINGTESFGMVQVESMSCGTPVIATDLPGIRQPVLISGLGRIVPPRDSLALAGALQELLYKPGKDGERAKLVSEAYSPLTIAKQYESIFKELVKQ